MRRPLIVLAVLITMVAGLAPGASAAQRVRFDHAGDYADRGNTSIRYLGKNVEVTTTGLRSIQTIDCANRPCRQAGLDGTDFSVERTMRIYLEIDPDEFKGSDEELQALVRGRSRTTAIFTDGFESGDVTRITGTATCSRTPLGVRVCDIEMEVRGRVVGARGGVIGWTVGHLTGTLRVPGNGARWTALAERGAKALDADGFGL